MWALSPSFKAFNPLTWIFTKLNIFIKSLKAQNISRDHHKELTEGAHNHTEISKASTYTWNCFQHLREVTGKLEVLSSLGCMEQLKREQVHVIPPEFSFGFKKKDYSSWEELNTGTGSPAKRWNPLGLEIFFGQTVLWKIESKAWLLAGDWYRWSPEVPSNTEFFVILTHNSPLLLFFKIILIVLKKQ